MATESTEAVTSRVLARNVRRSIRQQRVLGLLILVLIAVAVVILVITLHNRGNTNALRHQVDALQGQNRELTRENTSLKKQVDRLTPLIKSQITETLKNRSFGNDSRRISCEVLNSIDHTTWANNADCQALAKQPPPS